MVVEHKHKIGFKGTILIEPKPFEPTKHQYDFDVATVYALPAALRPGEGSQGQHRGQPRHAGRPRLRARDRRGAARYGILGSLDINRGDPRSGWDTDQFPNNAQDLVPAMLQLIEGGGFGTGGFNFDAKLRRQSIDPADLYLAHIGGMDTLARALLAAADDRRGRRASSASATSATPAWSSDLGRRIDAGEFSLAIWPTTPSRTISIRSHARAGRNSPNRIVARHCRF